MDFDFTRLLILKIALVSYKGSRAVSWDERSVTECNLAVIRRTSINPGSNPTCISW